MARPKSPPRPCKDCGKVAQLICDVCRKCYDHRRNGNRFGFEAAQIKELENSLRRWNEILTHIRIMKKYNKGFEKYIIREDQFQTIHKIAVEQIEAAAERERLENSDAPWEGELSGEGVEVKPEHDPAQPMPSHEDEVGTAAPQPQIDDAVEVGTNPAQRQPQIEVEQVSPQTQPQSPPSPPMVPQPPPKPFVSEWTGKKCAVCGKGTYTVNEFTGTCEDGHYYVLPPTTPPQSIAPPTEPGSPAKSVSQEGGFSNDPPK